MKHLHTYGKVNHQTTDSSLKKPPMLFVFVLCLLIMIIIAVTTMLLGITLSRFTDRETNMISLALSENVSSQSGEGRNAGSQTGANHGGAQVQDDVQSWSSETHIDLFHESYDGTVESDDGGKRIAPGTSNYYDFTVKNNDNIPLDYSISIEVDTFFEGQKINSEIPLEWRLLTADKEIISDWQKYNERTKVLKKETLGRRHRDSYIIEWRWIFERGRDKEDTELGNLAVNQPIGVNATIYVHAEQNTDRDGKPSILPRTGDAFNPVLYLVLLVISLCGLLILIVVYKRRKKDEDVQDDQK